MNVGVGIRGHELAMSRERIMDFYPYGIERPGTIPAILTDQPDPKLVLMHNLSLITCAIRQRDDGRFRRCVPGRIDHFLLEIDGRVSVSNTGQVAVYGMTVGAVACAIEKRFAGLRISGEKTLKRIA